MDIRATCSTFRFEAELQFQVLARKIGHSYPRSARAYHNNDGVLGKQLQANMLGEQVGDANIGLKLWLCGQLKRARTYKNDLL